MIDQLIISASSGEPPVVSATDGPDGNADGSVVPRVTTTDAVSAPISTELVEHDAAGEPSLIAWEPDGRIAEAGSTEPAERPSQSRFFADAEARRLSRIKR